MKSNTKNTISISKDSFINFLSSATPEEINQYINEKGKPGKMIDPMNMYSEKKKKELQSLEKQNR